LAASRATNQPATTAARDMTMRAIQPIMAGPPFGVAAAAGLGCGVRVSSTVQYRDGGAAWRPAPHGCRVGQRMNRSSMRLVRLAAVAIVVAGAAFVAWRRLQPPDLPDGIASG